MPQAFPFIISGTVKWNGIAQAGVTVSIKNNTKDQTGTWITDDVGEYAASLSDPVQFSSGYDVSDSVTISWSSLSETVAVPSGAGSTVGGMIVDLIGFAGGILVQVM